MIQLTHEEVQQVLAALQSLFGVPDKYTGLGGGAVAVWRLGGSAAPRDAISLLQSKLAEQCFCDRNNLGKPGVSCGDCPTRDYKTEKDAVYPVDSDDDRTSMPVYLRPAPKPVSDFDIRGKLSTLKCWHRLSGDEVQDLIEFFGGSSAAPRPVENSNG